MRYYIKLRQDYMLLSDYAVSDAARTILVQNIPPEMLSYKALNNVFSVFPGGVSHIIINS